MTAVMIWKEYRQHRHVWLALAVLAVAILVGVPLAMGGQAGTQTRTNLAISALVLVWVHGLVCGAALLAGEQEEGTQGMLDHLPAWRAVVWRAKLLSGLVFVLLFCAAVASLTAWQEEVLVNPAVTVVLVLGCGLLGLSLGLGASAFARSSMEAVGLALVGLLGGSAVAYVLAVGLVGAASLLLREQFSGAVVAATTALITLVAPVTVSGLRYTAADKGRVGAPPRPQGPGPSAWGQLNWLCWRGFAWPTAGCLLFGLLGGLVVAQAGLHVYPPASLVLGVVCGLCLFQAENGGAHRFWAEQRLPLGRLWWHKVGFGLAALSLGLVGLLLPSMALTLDGGFSGEKLLVRLGGVLLARGLIPIVPYLLLWPMTGFGVAAVLGLLNRKLLTALVLSLAVSACLCGPWVPSMLAGGLSSVLPLLPAAGLLVLSRSLVHPWATERLGSPEVVLRVAAACLFVALVIGGGLAWRVYEVPDVPEPDGLQAMIDRLPTPEENEAGRLVRQALARAELPNSSAECVEQAAVVIEKGWEAAEKELREELDAAFAGEWPKLLAEAARLPVGVVDDPRRLTVGTHLPHLEKATVAGKLLAAQGLRLQAEKGDHAAFVAYLEMGLGMVRNLERSAGRQGLIARSIERSLLTSHERWLEGVPQEARTEWFPAFQARNLAILARAEEVLRRHQERLPPDESKYAEYLFEKNTADAPGLWASRGLGASAEEAELVALALNVPWERTRQERALRAFWFGQNGLPDKVYPITNPPTARTIGLDRPANLARREFRLTAARVITALRCYQAEKGKPAGALAELVPRHLPSVPNDPYAGKPLNYRLSKGEAIDWPESEVDGDGAKTRQVPPGQGVIWAAGEDGKDDGGTRNVSGYWLDCQPGQDVVVLVPQPRK